MHTISKEEYLKREFETNFAKRMSLDLRQDYYDRYQCSRTRVQYSAFIFGVQLAESMQTKERSLIERVERLEQLLVERHEQSIIHP